MFTISNTIAIPIFIGAIVHFFSKQRSVITFLQLYSICTIMFRHSEHILAKIQITLMIVTNFSDDITIIFVVDHVDIND